MIIFHIACDELSRSLTNDTDVIQSFTGNFLFVSIYMILNMTEFSEPAKKCVAFISFLYLGDNEFIFNSPITEPVLTLAFFKKKYAYL